MEKFKNILVQKASGEEELFSLDKLEASLKSAGARPETISKIVHDLHYWIHPGIPTKAIYKRAFQTLRHEKTTSALRYKLKQAIFELGPTGFPFESLIGQLFEKQGYKTEVGVVCDGKYITHEMDVIATNKMEQNLVECKYHKSQGIHVSVQVPLYVRSRVNDIIDFRKEQPHYSGLTFKGWVVTNTRFSSDSTNYGTGSGLNLLGWSFPHGRGLKELVYEYRIYPITVLKNLTIKEKRLLLDEGIVTCSQLVDNTDVLKPLGLPSLKKSNLLKELYDICE